MKVGLIGSPPTPVAVAVARAWGIPPPQVPTIAIDSRGKVVGYKLQIGRAHV